MNDAYEYFKKATFNPETLFSADNPLLQVAGKAHRSLFEALDTTARANVSLATDLLDLNRKRLEDLYAGKPLSEQLQAQADALFESGQRITAWSEDLRDAARAYRSTVTELTSDVLEQPAPAAKKANRKTSKAA